MGTIIGTSTLASGYAAGLAFQPHAFVAAGRVWIIYHTGTYLVYVSSADFVNWTDPSTISSMSSGAAASVVFDGTKVHLAYGYGSADCSYRSGTPQSNGAISFNNAVTMGLSGTFTRIYNMDIDANGYIYVCYYKDQHVYVGKNADKTGATWTNASGYPVQATTSASSSYYGAMRVKTTGLYVLTSLPSGYLKGRYYSGSAWSSEETLSSAALAASGRFSITSLGEVVEIAYTLSTGIATRRRNSSGTWESEMLASSLTSTTTVGYIVATAAETWLVYQDNGYLKYRTSLNGAAWSAATNKAAGTFGALNYISGSRALESDSKFYVIRTEGSASPWNVVVDSFQVNVTLVNLPVASFTATPTQGVKNLAVSTTDTTTNTPTSWDWDWGDGSAHSTTQNASHTYTTVGTYTIKLTATNSRGSSTATAIIRVDDTTAPIASFSLDEPSGEVPHLVTFYNYSTGGVAHDWLWDFGDGTTSTEQAPRHIFGVSGEYTVTLTASNLSGSSQATGYVSTSLPTGNSTNPLADWRKPTSCSIHRCFAADTFLRPHGILKVPYYDELKKIGLRGTSNFYVGDSDTPSYGYAFAKSLDGKALLVFKDRPEGNPVNSTFEVLLKLHSVPYSSTTNECAGSLVFRYADQNNYYYVRMGYNGILELRKVINGIEIQLALVTISNWASLRFKLYRLKVRVQDDIILVTLNDTLYISVVDSSIPSGSCGVMVNNCSIMIYRMVWFDEAPENKLLGWMPFNMESFDLTGDTNSFIKTTMANLGIFGAQAGTDNRKVNIKGCILHGVGPIHYVGESSMKSSITCLEYLRASGYVVYVMTPTHSCVGHITNINYPKVGPYVSKYSDFSMDITELWG